MGIDEPKICRLSEVIIRSQSVFFDVKIKWSLQRLCCSRIFNNDVTLLIHTSAYCTPERTVSALSVFIANLGSIQKYLLCFIIIPAVMLPKGCETRKGKSCTVKKKCHVFQTVMNRTVTSVSPLKQGYSASGTMCSQTV